MPLSVSFICICITVSDVVRCMGKPGKFICEKLSQVLKLVWCFLGRDSTCFGQVVNCEQEFLAHWAYYYRQGSSVGWPELTRILVGPS